MSQKQNKNHCIFISIITLLLCITAADPNATVSAKSTATPKKLNISRSSMNMKSGSQKKLTIRNAHKKVKWISSNRKIAAITSKTGKYRNKAVIRAKKAGSCTITAKSASVKCKCRVRVLKKNNAHNSAPESSQKPNADTGNSTQKPNQKPNTNTDTVRTAGIQFESVSTTENSMAVTLKMYNNTEQQLYYGLSYRIEKQIDGEWTILETTKPPVIPAIACIMSANSYHYQTFHIDNLKNPATNGNYRITLTEMSQSDPALHIKVENSTTFQITDCPDNFPKRF